MEKNLDDLEVVQNFAEGIMKDMQSALAQRTEIAQDRRKKIIVLMNEVIGPTGDYAKNFGIYRDIALFISRELIDRVSKLDKGMSHTSLCVITNDCTYLNTEGRVAYWNNIKQSDDLENFHPAGREHLLPGLSSGKRGREPFGRVSEKRLRNQYDRWVQKNQKGIQTILEEEQVTCAADGSCGELCAREMVMCLRHCKEKHDADHVIGLLPSTCHYAIEAGIERTKALSKLLIPHMRTPMTVDHYSLDSATPSTVRQLFSPHLPDWRKKLRHTITFNSS